MSIGWPTVSGCPIMVPGMGHEECTKAARLEEQEMTALRNQLMIALIAAGLASSAAGQAPLAVWTVDPHLKVFRDAQPAQSPGADEGVGSLFRLGRLASWLAFGRKRLPTPLRRSVCGV